MTAPASYSRVMAALRRLSPSFPNTDEDTAVGKELGSIGTAVATAVDRFDAVPDELFPDTATETIERWEKVFRVPIRTADPIADRRNRVLSVLRRSSGPRLDQLAKMLAIPLGIDVDDVIFYEMLGQPWPGVVDAGGVRLYMSWSSLGTPAVTVTSPDGTIWTPTVNEIGGWYYTRTAFLDETAGGSWQLSVANGSAVNLTQAILIVSNDIDSAQIYNFFAFCDPGTNATPDLIESQRLFHRTALGHLKAFVTQSTDAVVDDQFSLVDRDPVGA